MDFLVALQWLDWLGAREWYANPYRVRDGSSWDRFVQTWEDDRPMPDKAQLEAAYSEWEAAGKPLMGVSGPMQVITQDDVNLTMTELLNALADELGMSGQAKQAVVNRLTPKSQAIAAKGLERAGINLDQ